MKDKEIYLNTLNLELRTQEDIENLLKEYENGNLTRDEYICVSFVAHSITNSLGFTNGWETREKILLNKARK